MGSLKGEEGNITQLPVLVSQIDQEKYPDFKKLLKTLTKYIEADGTTKEVKQDYLNVQCSLRQEKLRFHQAKVIFDELKDLLLDHEIDKVDHDQDNQSVQLYTTAKKALTATEVVDHLDFNPEVSGSGVTLLGLTGEQMKENDSHKMIIQQGLIPELENRLKSKCEQVVQYHEFQSKKQDGDDKFAFAKATQLPAIIEAEKLSLQEENKLLKEDRMIKDTQFVQYYQTLVHSFEVFENLITHQKLEWQKKYDRITSDWLAAKCQAMCLKIKVLQKQLLCGTYTPETMAALKQIRECLQRKEDETKRELHRVVQALQVYKSLGMGFDGLVRNYGELIAEVDNKKWALTEFRHSEHDTSDLWK